MSRSIYIMGSNDRRATQRLIRDMSKLKSKAARLKRLKQETKKIEKVVAHLKASLTRLESKSGSYRAINSEERRLTQVTVYRNHVFRWQRAPMEGTK